MKRMGTMQRLVRLAVGSLCLLVLMVHAAAAAEPPPPQIFCLIGNYRDDGATRGISAEVSVSNIDSGPQQFTVAVFNKENPQGVGKTMTLAAFEKRDLAPQALGTSGLQGVLVVQSNVYPVVTLSLTNSNGGFSVVTPQGCFSSSQQ